MNKRFFTAVFDNGLLSSRQFRIHLLFIVLILAIQGSLFAYWSLILEPRIKSESDANAQILAESQGRALSLNLISPAGILQIKKIHEVLDTTELLKDPVLGQAFFTSVQIELDPNSIAASQAGLAQDAFFIERGKKQCEDCFNIEVALYSPLSNELIGLANFYVNDAIFHQYITDMQNKILIEALVILLIAMAIWYGVIRLAKQWQLEISERKKAQQKADEANRAKSQFLANMSHELRTPLNAVIGMNYLISRGELEDKQRQRLQKMETSAQVLLTLINDILDFSKNEAGKLELENIPFALDDVLENIQRLNTPSLEEKQLSLQIMVAPEVPKTLIGDPVRLGQILLNLSNNAIKFSSEGEVVITIELSQELEKSATLRFCVSDPGIGIDKEQQNKLFQSFSQIDQSTTRLYGGTGLGLAICKQIVDLMQGSIWLESELGQGSQFYFEIEFEKAKEKLISSSSPLSLDSLPVWPSVRILLVEDIIINQEIIVSILEETQMMIDTANNGIEAIKAISQYDYDLVLMDIQMPQMNGYQATELIREQYSADELPIIAMTAYSLDKDKKACLDIGMNDFIAKPVIVANLFSVLKQWLPEPINYFTKSQNVNTAELESLQKQFPGIHLLEALQRSKGDLSRLAELLQHFLENNKDSLAVLNHLLKHSQWQELETRVHALKGTSGNLCLDNIYQACLELKPIIDKQNPRVAQNIISNLEVDFQEIISLANELERYIHRQHDATPAMEDEDNQQDLSEAERKKVILDLLSELQQLIAGNNLKAAKTLESLQCNINALDELAQVLAAFDDWQLLSQYLSQLDFDKAQEAFNKSQVLLRKSITKEGE